MPRRTVVVNKRKEKYDVYIGRGSMFGNPFEIGKDGTREEVIEKYKPWFEKKLRNDRFKAAVRELRGKRLGCYCAPQSCHGDIIVKWLEEDSGGGDVL